MPSDEALWSAVGNIAVAEAAVLIRRGANIAQVSPGQGWTLLHLAIDAEVDLAPQWDVRFQRT